MSHKLGTWQAQFDESGCVGCGRCITWCPVGIDITAQARLLQSSRRAGRAEESV
jgi:ferredoxin